MNLTIMIILKYNLIEKENNLDLKKEFLSKR